MRPSRIQFGTPLLVHLGAQLFILNLVCFLIAFSILPLSRTRTMDGVKEGNQAGDKVAAQAGKTGVPWVVLPEHQKMAPLPLLFIHEGELTRSFTVTEWAAWKQKAASWSQRLNLPGFIRFSENLLKLQRDGTFAPLYDGAAPLAAIVEDVDMKRHVLEVFLTHVWNLPTAPRHTEVKDLATSEIEFQFSHLAKALFRIFGAIVDSSTPDASKCPGGQPVSLYSEILEASEGPLKLTEDTDHPLAACMAFLLLEAKFKSDPSGSTKDMEDQLHHYISSVQQGSAPILSLGNLPDFFVKILVQYRAIANRDKDGVYSLNRNLQESMRKAVQVACLCAERQSPTFELQLAAANFRADIRQLELDTARQSISFETFYNKLVGLCTKHIPASSAFSALKPATLPSIDSVASNTTTTSAPTMAMAATISTPGQLCCSESLSDLVQNYGYSAVAGALRIQGRETPKDWMCESCCRLGHRKQQCTFPPLPEAEREQKLQAHRAKRTTHNKQRRARQAAQGKTASNANGAGNNTNRSGGGQGGGGSNGGRQQGGNQRSSLKITFPNNIPGGTSNQLQRNVRQRADSGYIQNPSEAHLDEALAAFGEHSYRSAGSNSRFEDVTDQDYYVGNISVPTCAAWEPQRIGLPILLLLAITGFLASQVPSAQDDLTLGLATVALPIAFCLYFLVPMVYTMPNFASPQVPLRPRSTVAAGLRLSVTTLLIVAAVFLHFSAGANAAVPNTTHAFMTAAERLANVFLDTGCSRTMFCSAALLINVRPLAAPIRIGGAVPGSVVAYQLGDYPLVLTDDTTGERFVGIIKDCLVAPRAQANLLSHNELQQAGVGILVPDNTTEPVMLFWKRKGKDPAAKCSVCMEHKHGLIPLPNPDGPLIEISDDCPGAADLTSRHTAFGATHHQLRPLTACELWHNRLNHAHPYKIAKLSHNCIGIKTPLAEFQVPCHDCMDANIRRNDLPPPSEHRESGAWNVDMLDMGAKNLSLGKNRYITIIVAADSRYAHIYPHKTKDEFQTILLTALSRTPNDKQPRILRTDGAGEYITPAINKILLDRGIQKQTSNPDEQFGNGKAETLVAAIGRGIRVALLSSGLGTAFWGLAAINWVDIYNHLPHASLGFKTPWEVEMGSKPDVSWFRPFGCRVTVFRGREHAEHHKLAPRGEACVYVGLGHHRGQKGWLCYSPVTQRVYCTRHCVFDETFMPMRLHDQRILGYYDTTPRTRLVKQHFGSLENAIKTADDLWDLPVDFTPEPVDPDARELTDQVPPHFFNPEGTNLFADDPDPAPAHKRQEPDDLPQPATKLHNTGTGFHRRPASLVSGGPQDPASASGGSPDGSSVSGGPRGGAGVSGGNVPDASSRIHHRDARFLSSGGANTGVDPSMLSAGVPGPASSRQVQQTLDDHFDWTTLGPRLISDVNNYELTEWLIGNGITLVFRPEFWPEARVPGPWQGFVHDTTRDNPPRARIWLFTTQERHVVRITSNAGTHLTVRDAVRDTYPEAKTMDDLCAAFLGSDLVKEQAQDDDTDDDEDGNTTAKRGKTKPNNTRTNKAAKQQRTQPSNLNQAVPDTRPRRNATTRCAAMAFSCLQESLGITSASTKINHARRAETKLHVRNDTEGCTYAALTATTYVCLLAESFGYNAAFIPPEPRSQRDARNRADREHWEAAEQKELNQLWKMGTFMLVNRPANYDPLPLHFVYKLKVKDGDFNNVTHKARLVMRGNLQYEHEYGETYAPTARLWSIRTLTALSAQEGLTLKKFDLTSAFLVADIQKELYVEIPGYAVPDGKALMLKKALYGGRDSGALYSKEITAWLRNYGFQPTSVDETLFRKERDGPKGKEIIILSLYVDDGACATNSEAFYKEFMSALQSKYQLSDQGKLEWHLGMKFTQDLKNGTIKIDQKAYIEAMLERFDMKDANERDTPLAYKTKLSKADCPSVPDKRAVKAYQQLVGSLMYVACATRPDIAYAVNTCAQFMSNPGHRHEEAAKHILRYLKGTKNVGITYSKQCDEKLANKLFGYVDADHASDADDRKSVGGYVLMLNGGAVSWSSRKIKVVAISSFESEWYSASIAGCEVKAMRRLLEEIGFEQKEPTTLFEDNASCIYSSEVDRPMNPCSKHIDIRVFKLKEFVQEGTLKLVKVASVRQVADNLTKPLPKEGVEMARSIMSGEESAREARARAARTRAYFGFMF